MFEWRALAAAHCSTNLGAINRSWAQPELGKSPRAGARVASPRATPSSLKVAHGTTPSDTSLFLEGPAETPPQKLCEGLASALEAQGFKPDAEQLLRVTPANYNVSFKGPKEQVGLFCHARADASATLIDLSRKPL